jgi:hypothetical protein
MTADCTAGRGAQHTMIAGHMALTSRIIMPMRIDAGGALPDIARRTA